MAPKSNIKMRTKPNITIIDVAKKAGVSTATVSRVLSGQKNVSKELVNRVFSAVDELEYRVSRTAQSLRSNVRSKKIGLIVSDIVNPYFTSVIRGIENVLIPNNYALLLGDSLEDPAIEFTNIEIMLEEEVSGIIMNTVTADQDIYQELAQQGVPIVFFDRFPQNIQADTVKIDNFGAAHKATQHLIGLGHTDIGFIGLNEQASSVSERRDGYLRAIKDAGLVSNKELIIKSNLQVQGGYEGMKQLLLSQKNNPRAILCANNQTTTGALIALSEFKINIPDDIAIIGFDDMPWAASYIPALTVIDQNPSHIGKNAAGLVLARIKNPNLPIQRFSMDAELIIRKSCGSL